MEKCPEDLKEMVRTVWQRARATDPTSSMSYGVRYHEVGPHFVSIELGEGEHATDVLLSLPAATGLSLREATEEAARSYEALGQPAATGFAPTTLADAYQEYTTLCGSETPAHRRDDLGHLIYAARDVHPLGWRGNDHDDRAAWDALFEAIGSTGWAFDPSVPVAAVLEKFSTIAPSVR